MGTIPLELLRAGGTRATVVEPSRSEDGPARRLAERAGLAGRIDRRQALRVHVHPPAAIAAAVTTEGLEPRDRHRGLLWELRRFTR